jgi:riboflavin kinase, archaea type
MLSGVIVSGTGEGSFYVEQYLNHLEGVLGFTCFAGTLNVKVSQKINFNDSQKLVVAPEGMGQVDCYLVKIGEYDGAIVVPHRTRHGEDVLEIVSAVNLREKLKLKNGDEFSCELV